MSSSLYCLFLRYRELRKDEEKIINQKHNKNLRKHTEMMKLMCDSKDCSEQVFNSSPSENEEIQDNCDDRKEIDLPSSSEISNLPPNSTIIDNLSYSKVRNIIFQD